MQSSDDLPDGGDPRIDDLDRRVRELAAEVALLKRSLNDGAALNSASKARTIVRNWEMTHRLWVSIIVVATCVLLLIAAVGWLVGRVKMKPSPVPVPVVQPVPSDKTSAPTPPKIETPGTTLTLPPPTPTLPPSPILTMPPSPVNVRSMRPGPTPHPIPTRKPLETPPKTPRPRPTTASQQPSGSNPSHGTRIE